MRSCMAVGAVLTLCAEVGLLGAGGAGKDDVVKKELQALKGTWAIVLAEQDGKDVTDKGVTLTFDAAGKAVVKKGDKLLFEGTIKVDPSKKPKQLDATQESEGGNKGKTIPGIYELDGDNLKVCSTAPGKDRPKEFSSKAGSGHFLRVYKRVPAGEKQRGPEADLDKFTGRWTASRERKEGKKVVPYQVVLDFKGGEMALFVEEDGTKSNDYTLKVFGVDKVAGTAQLRLGHGKSTYTVHCDFDGDRLFLVGRLMNRPFEAFSISGEYKRAAKGK